MYQDARCGICHLFSEKMPSSSFFFKNDRSINFPLGHSLHYVKNVHLFLYICDPYLLISHFQVYGTEAIALVVSLGERRSMDFFVSMEIEWILVTSYFLMLFSLGHKERHVEEEYDMRRAAQICREMTVNDKKGVRF